MHRRLLVIENYGNYEMLMGWLLLLFDWDYTGLKGYILSALGFIFLYDMCLSLVR